MEKLRYTDAELAEFKTLIIEKLEKARRELKILQESLYDDNEDGAVNASGGQKLMDEAADVSEREQNSQLAERQQKFIANLENAIERIDNKTYGICKATGNLISKERLRAVPHTTLSIEAKQNQ